MVATAWPRYLAKNIINHMKNAYLKIIYRILAFYARRVILQNDPKIIAVTGSVGKTSTKDAIYEVLHDAFGSKVRKTEGTLNAEIGLPLTILGYKEVPNKFIWPFFLVGLAFRKYDKNYPEYLVLEMGVERAGDLVYFANIARPDIAVITTVTAAHVANFRNVEEYQKEKLSILTKMKPGGKVIINIDDPILAGIENREIITISAENKAADYYSDDITISLSGTEYRINFTGHKISVKSALLGRQAIYSQLFGFAIGNILGIQSIKTGKSLSKIKPIAGRMNFVDGKNGVIIIDDTYNSNPTSLKAALTTLSEIKFDGRKVAIIGNMNELGGMEQLSHEEVGRFAKDKCDLAIFAGPNAAGMSKAFGPGSLAFAGRAMLIERLPSLIKEGDLVLVKASQNGNFFEEVAKFLMKKPSDAQKLLVRQGKFWKNRKS